MRKKIISGLLMGLAFFGLTQSTSAQCTQVSPYSEGFSSYPPTCWTEAQGRLSILKTLTGTSSSWTNDGFLNSGSSGSARVNIYGTSADEWIISPIIDLGTGTSSYQLEFDAGLTDYIGSGSDLMSSDDSLAVVISLDSGDTWTTANILKLYTAGNQPSNSGENVVIDLTPYTGKVKIGFYAASSVSNTDYNVYIDNFAINPLATCPKPTALAIAELTPTSADFYWMESGTATSWQVELGTSGYTAGTGAKTVYTADSITIAGLLSNTAYDVYVRAICSSSDSSAWVGPTTFRTLCAPFTAPYFNDFEASSTNMAPSCWSSYKTNSGSYAEVRASTPYSGVNAINMYSSGASTSGSDSLILATPQFSDLIVGNKQISFYVRSSSLLNALLIGTVASPDPTATFNPIDTVLFSSTTSYEEVIIPFTTANGYNGTDQYIVFASNLGSTYTYIRIDDFNYTIIPSCPKPSGLMASAITSNSASFNWTESGSATSWQIQYDTVNFPIGTGNKSVVASDSVNVTGLISQTDYDVYVRAICGSSDTSVWLGPISFTTSCGAFSAPFVEDFNTFVPTCWNEAGNGTPNTGITSIGSGDWKSANFLNASANGKGVSINLYDNVDKEWIISPTLDLTSGAPLELVISAGVTNYNSSSADNMGSDDEVLVLISEDNMTSWDTLYTWNVSNQPPTAGLDYRISLAGYSTNNNIVAIWATDGSINDSEDYDFHIGKFELRTAPSCSAPIANSGTNSLTATSAEISWTETATATSWRVEYDTLGYAAGTARNTVVVTDTFAILTGLAANTDYEWNVSALCSVTDSSIFVGNSFTTPPSCLAPTANSGTNSLSATSAEVSWIENGTATSWRVEYDTIGYATGTARNTVVVTDTFAIIAGLSSNTSYDWNVRALCSSTDSSTLVGNSFFTGYCLVSTTNSGDYISSLVSTGANTNVSYTATSNPAGSYADETAQTLTSYAAGTFDITTTYVGGSNGVKVWVDWNNDLVFDDVTELIGYQVSSAASKTISGAVPATATVGNYRMRVRAQWGSSANPPSCGNVSYGTTVDLTVSLITPPLCLGVSGLSSSELTSNSVDLFWTENNTATSWQLEYDVTGYTQGNGAKSVVVSDSITLGSLSSNTTYDAYVRAICSSTDTSSWVGPITFTTLCAPYTAPYAEDFNTFVPNCWEEASTGDLTTGPATLAAGDWRVGDFANNAANGGGARINLYTNSRTEWLVSPTIDLSNGSYELAIEAAVTNWNTSAPDNMGSDDSVQVVISTDGGLTWTSIYTWDANNQPPTLGQKYRIDLSSYTSANNIFGIYATDGPIDDLEDYDFHIGSFDVRVPPTCPEPIVNATSLIGSDSAFVSWVETGSAIQWEVEYGLGGYTVGTGSSIIVNIDTFTIINGLNSNTTYDYYVRAICSSTDTSTWTNSSTFTTSFLPCALTTTTTLPFFEDWENLNDTVTGPANIICNPDYTWHLLSSNPNGRARFGSAAILAAGGTGAITLDAITSSGVIANDLILTLNLAANSSASNLELEFDFAHHGEENNANDSVWIRGSQSDTWVGIYDLFANKGSAGVYNSVGPIDIDARLAAAGQTVSSSFQIRFGQEDDFPATSPTASDGFSFDNISVKLGPLPYYPVGTINTEDANTGIADSLGVFCWTSGTVAGIDLDGNAGISFTIIDQSGTNPEGINIYNFADVSNYVVTEGDSIMIRGEIQQFNGLTELFPDSISIISTGASLPSVAVVTTLDESTESALIRIEDLTVTSVPAGTSINIGLTDGTNNFVMRVDSDTDVLDSLTFAVGDKLCSVNGIGGQFDNSNPYLSGYQIFPMRYTDVVFAPSVSLGPDTIVCDTNNFMLDAGNFASYVWSTGALTRTITPTTANTTYSVIVTDGNGCTGTDTVNVTITVCVGITEVNQAASSINFYPNPNNGQFKLKIENVTAPNSMLEIVNIQGQVVYNENLIINGSLSKDININVEKGIYFVKLSNKNGVKVEKLIID